MALPLLLLPVLTAIVGAIPIDNGVRGYPQVTCGSQSIKVSVQTERPLNGRIFVKGEAAKGNCNIAFGYETPPGREGGYPEVPRPEYAPQPGLDLKFGECNMRRQRTLYPKGVEYTFTMVISFHPLFITKVDRAYRVRCFYMEADKTVKSAVDVRFSMLTTHQINEQYPMPKCNYHLNSGSHDGPYLRFAMVGDKIIHSWICDRESAYLYGILVKNCYVDDGEGNKFLLIDEQGCTTDRHLLATPEYDPSLITASVESHVFKYADKQSLQFSCTIQLCFKNDGGCHGITPPQCGYGGNAPPRGFNSELVNVKSGAPAPRPHFPIPHQDPRLHPQPPHGSLESSPHEFQPESNEFPPIPHQPDSHGPIDLPPARPFSLFPSHPDREERPPSPPPHNPSHPFFPTDLHVPHPLHQSRPAGATGPLVFSQGPPPPPGPFEPFKKLDDPITQDSQPNSHSRDKKKKSRRARSMEEKLETDLSAPPLTVLPFDEDVDTAHEQHIQDLKSTERKKMSTYTLFHSEKGILPGICISPGGFGILIALLTTIFTFAFIVSGLLLKRNWDNKGRNRV